MMQHRKGPLLSAVIFAIAFAALPFGITGPGCRLAPGGAAGTGGRRGDEGLRA